MTSRFATCHPRAPSRCSEAHLTIVAWKKPTDDDPRWRDVEGRVGVGSSVFNRKCSHEEWFCWSFKTLVVFVTVRSFVTHPRCLC